MDSVAGITFAQNEYTDSLEIKLPSPSASNSTFLRAVIQRVFCLLTLLKSSSIYLEGARLDALRFQNRVSNPAPRLITWHLQS